MLVDDAREFLKNSRLMFIASISSENVRPQGAYVYYAVDSDFNIYFNTTKGSIKIRNIQANPHVALVIAVEIEPKVMQIEGTAKVLSPEDVNIDILNQIAERSNPALRSSWSPLILLSKEKGTQLTKIRIDYFKYSNFSLNQPFITEGTQETLQKKL